MDPIQLLGRVDKFLGLQERQAVALERIAEALENIELAPSDEAETPIKRPSGRPTLNLAALDHLDR